jgi:hypothetical protein
MSLSSDKYTWSVKVKKNKKILTNKERIQKIKEQQEHEMFLMFKYLFATVVMIVGIMAVLTIRKGMMAANFYENAKLPLEIVFGALSAIFAVLCIILKSKKVDQRKRVINTFDLFAVSLSGFLLFFSYGFIDLEYDSGRIIAIIVLTVLYFIYTTGNKVLFTVSAQSAASILGATLLQIFNVSLAVKISLFVFFVLVCSVGAWVYYIGAVRNEKNGKKGQKRLIVNTVFALACLIVSLAVPAAVTYAIYGILAVYLAIIVIPAIEMV